LNAILGWVQILKDEPTAEDVAQAVPIIERNVRAQSQLIEDLLDMSRIEAGKIKLDIQQIDLAALVSAGIESIRPAAQAKQIRLTSAFSNVFGIVIGDKDRLQQVIWNLLINAIKFTPKHGRIHTAIKRVDSHVEISVNDTGQGIGAEFLPHVFDRFRQGDATTTRRHGGLGLGLSIVKHLTELHGGNVRATSDGVGRGATFSVCLPLQSLEKEADDAAESQRHGEGDRATIKANLNGIKVLVVDDEKDSVTIVRRILERRGAQVRGAHSMNEALAQFASFSPNVILSDIDMPGNDGYELISRLRGMPGGPSVPAVALTALARGEDRTRALRAGFQMHVAKPVDFNELVAVVQNLAALRSEDR
jgi:CheY-like chemotaxis protein